LQALDSKQEIFFKEFYEKNADIICAALGIPPNVAWSVYNDSFSASRAATKDWEHTIDVERNGFQVQFYEPIFNFWLFTEILKKKIVAPGYMEAFDKNNYSILEAYQNVRYTGPMFPHIDPLKEAKAEREKLGSQFRNTPLTTLERSTEVLNGGDSISNIEQASQELKTAEGLGFDTKPEGFQNNDLLKSD
jgi:capsid protein